MFGISVVPEHHDCESSVSLYSDDSFGTIGFRLGLAQASVLEEPQDRVHKRISMDDGLVVEAVLSALVHDQTRCNSAGLQGTIVIKRLAHGNSPV